MGRLLVLCGTPCTGKSTLGEWLQHKHQWLFINHDFRRGAPSEPGEETLWWHGIESGTLREFAVGVQSGERDVVVEFGFPLHLLPLVRQLHDSSDVQLWWFQGDRFLARELFIKRNSEWLESGVRPPIPVSAFDNTVAFQRANWDAMRPLFRHRVLECLSPGRDRLTAEALFAAIAGAAGWR